VFISSSPGTPAALLMGFALLAAALTIVVGGTIVTAAVALAFGVQAWLAG
jgi:hypothetical protein